MAEVIRFHQAIPPVHLPERLLFNENMVGRRVFPVMLWRLLWDTPEYKPNDMIPGMCWAVPQLGLPRPIFLPNPIENQKWDCYLTKKKTPIHLG